MTDWRLNGWHIVPYNRACSPVVFLFFPPLLNPNGSAGLLFTGIAIGRTDLTIRSMVLVGPLILAGVFLYINRGTRSHISDALSFGRTGFINLSLLYILLLIISIIIIHTNYDRPLEYFVIISIISGIIFIQTLHADSKFRTLIANGNLGTIVVFDLERDAQLSTILWRNWFLTTSISYRLDRSFRAYKRRVCQLCQLPAISHIDRYFLPDLQSAPFDDIVPCNGANLADRNRHRISDIQKANRLNTVDIDRMFTVWIECGSHTVRHGSNHTLTCISFSIFF